jgi:hypothetical protein
VVSGTDCGPGVAGHGLGLDAASVASDGEPWHERARLGHPGGGGRGLGTTLEVCHCHTLVLAP